MIESDEFRLDRSISRLLTRQNERFRQELAQIYLNLDFGMTISCSELLHFLEAQRDRNFKSHQYGLSKFFTKSNAEEIEDPRCTLCPLKETGQDSAGTLD